MSGFSIISLGFAFLLTVLLTGRYFYFQEIRSTARRNMKELEVELEKIDCSFEQLVYFITLPSHLPITENAAKEDIHLKYDVEQGMFPRLIGLKVYIENRKDTLMIAYLSMEQFRIPMLDRLYAREEMTKETYRKIASAKMMSSGTHKEIIDEVYHQLKVGQFDMGG
ncbi:hypothetical protein [Salimicrobium flavidum]|uniref:Uncharacterized protein n=1 Tax=Salimicrobium flavidum TaxID=570947 RepID=A0A1N7IRQ2_9BACI|nr:hypothetical protein [Salimicrobium flavidum]SIS39779.1 hypothetical protein SAMN05421687_10254 [Salimicrobium flavidum]